MSERGFEAVVEAVSQRVVPDESERTNLESAASDLLERTRSVAGELPVEADVVQVGSTARETWVSGDRDIDVFVQIGRAHV